MASPLVQKNFQLKNLGGFEPPSIRDSTPGLAVNGGPHRAEERSTSQRADTSNHVTFFSQLFRGNYARF